MQVQCLSSCPGPHVGSTLKHCSVLNALCYYPFPLCCYLSIMSSMLRQRGLGSVPCHWQCRSLCVFACSWMKTELFPFFLVTGYLFSNVMELLAHKRRVFLVPRLWWCPQVLRIWVWSGDGIFRGPMVRLWKHSIDFSPLHYLEDSAVTISEKNTALKNKYWKRWRKEFYSFV